MDGKIEIENANELKVKEITLNINGGGEYDISSFKEPEMIRIKNKNTHSWSTATIKLPSVCHQVILDGEIEIMNENEITIGNLERQNRRNHQRFVFGNDNDENESSE